MVTTHSAPCRGQKRCSEPFHSMDGGPSEVFSKTYPSFLTLKEGSTAFSKPFFSWRRLAALGIVQASLPLLSFAQPFPSGDKGCTNRPTWCYLFENLPVLP